MKLLLLMLLLLPTLAYAGFLEDGSCEIDTNCIISRQLINKTTGFPITDAFCNITIRNEDFSLISVSQMINDSSGFYNHTVNFNQTGTFPSIMNCNKINQTDAADVTFRVGIGTRNYFYLFLILIPILLFILGMQRDELVLIILSGFLITIFGVGIFMGLFPGIPDNFISDALSALLISIGLYFMIRASIEYVKEVG